MARSTFTRRAFLLRLGPFATAASAYLPAWANAADRRDSYGGLKTVRFEPSGFFRVEKADRWWFVTPDGSAFLSYGLNHANKEYLLQPYNIDHWKTAFGVQDPSDPAFGKAFVRKVLTDLDAFGMNSIGTHARKEEFGSLTVPYVQGLYFVRTPYWTRFFGDILNAQTAPPDDVVSLVAGYSDLIAYQFYDDYDAHEQILDHWSKLTGKPLFHADTCFSVPYRQMPAPIGAVCPDQETRARRFLNSASRSLSRPDVIGYNWCGWMDMWAEWRDERQHSGLQNPFGRYHDPMPETMARFGAQLYQLGRRGGR